MPLPAAVPFYTVAERRALGLGMPEGVLAYDSNGNPIIDPSALSPAPVIEGFNPDPSQAAVDAGITADVNEPMPPPPPQAPVVAHESRPSVQQEVAAQNGMGGPDTPIDPNAGQQYDAHGAFFSGMANAPHVPYGGGLAQFASMMGGGAAGYQAQMAEQRKGTNQPSSVKEYKFAQGEGYDGSYTDFKDQFGGNSLLKAMAAQQGITLKAEQTAYDRKQNEQKEQTAAEKEAYKRNTGTIPSGYETASIGEGEDAYEVLRPQRGTKDFNNPMMSGNVLVDNIGDLNRMRDLTKKHGTELRGVVAGEMSTLRRTILQRITSTWEMGALGDQEYAGLQKAIPDPGSWESGAISTDQMVKQFDVFIADYNKQLKRTGIIFEDWGYKNPWVISEDEKARFKKRKAAERKKANGQ